YKDVLTAYTFSAINLKDAPIDVATEVFTRLNEGGKALTLFEIMVAKTYHVFPFDPETNETKTFDLAEKLLGRPYFIMGRVVYGRQLGRQLGVPTANIRLQRYRAALEGVFAVTVMGLDQQYEGIANIGVRPTVDGKEPLLEVHIFDFDEEIYGRLLTVTFLNKVRDERTFDGLDSLKNQIEQDISETREWFAKRRLERDPDMVV
ncbi:MAG: hypothetical protein CMD56_04710, partial [Gammaproteobacteria bacterium]|nr:hypothetical protein [Gammaproteobacteria bacterium]